MSPPAEHILQIRNLIKTRPAYPGYQLTVPRLDLGRRERVALLGGSGSGKSTALDIIALILKPDKADVFNWFSPRGRRIDLAAAWRRGQADRLARLRLSGLGYVLQTGGLLPFLPVQDNILLPARIKGLAVAKKALAELSERLGIGGLLKKYPDRISVGERQRCAIARAVIHQPRLIVADEPTAALDPPTADRVFALLLEVSSFSTLVVATHEAHRVTGAGFRILKIECPPLEAGPTVKAVLRAESPHTPEAPQ